MPSTARFARVACRLLALQPACVLAQSRLDGGGFERCPVGPLGYQARLDADAAHGPVTRTLTHDVGRPNRRQ